MSVSVQQRGDRHQLRVTHRLLPKPFIHTFPDEAVARAYGKTLRDLLDKGVVPAAMLQQKRDNVAPVVNDLIKSYVLRATPAPSDLPMLNAFDFKELRLDGVTFKWAEDWVADMKVEKLAPGTIRKKVQSLSRVINWYWRSQEKVPVNPLAHLPTGYSTYSDGSKKDQKRNFRLGEHEAVVRAVLAGEKRPDRERPWPADDEFRLYFEVLVGTGMRMLEILRMEVKHLDFKRKIIDCQGSKGHRGVLKPRVVPMVQPVREVLQAWCKGRAGRVFADLWDGDPATYKKAQGRLSARFGTLFDYAKVPHLTEHDMRHEAACRWVLLRDKDGWIYNDTQICRIMGWDDPKMMLRYASLRGEDLTARLD